MGMCRGLFLHYCVLWGRTKLWGAWVPKWTISTQLGRDRYVIQLFFCCFLFENMCCIRDSESDLICTGFFIISPIPTDLMTIIVFFLISVRPFRSSRIIFLFYEVIYRKRDLFLHYKCYFLVSISFSSWSFCICFLVLSVHHREHDVQFFLNKSLITYQKNKC